MQRTLQQQVAHETTHEPRFVTRTFERVDDLLNCRIDRGYFPLHFGLRFSANATSPS